MRSCIFWTAGILIGVLIIAGLAYFFAIKPWYYRWGATDEEVGAPLPGDELVANPKILRTKAVTIAAPPEQVWPWLVQMGQDKAGLYSYEWLENLLGSDIHNSNRIVPEWQDLQPGDSLLLYPPEKAGPPAYIIAQVNPPRALVMGHQDERGRWVESWQFYLAPGADGTTRLIHRNRSQGQGGLWDALDFGYFIMERAMLLGIKQRAENRNNE
jgi:hypothetical protein